MGLSVTLSNALSGMKIGQNALDVLSHNVSNAGTPGYHRRAISVIDQLGVQSSYAREGMLTRAFNQSLQQHYTRSVSDSSFSSVRAEFLDRVQVLFGKPGTTGSLDSAFDEFQASLNALSTSPDNFASRADTVQKAQVLASTLNRLTSDVQSLRQEIESKVATSVDDLNAMLSSLERINTRLADQGLDPGSRATLLDQRDRLVNELSSQMDLRVSYRNDDTVALMTRSGIGVLDGRASVFSFESAGALSASSRFSSDDAQSGVGRLLLTTSSGFAIDLVKQNVLGSGELAGLIELRDKTLVQTQDQLDEIAAALARSLSTEVTAGTSVTSGAQAGFEADITGVRDGNEIAFAYTRGGIQSQVRVLRIDDATRLPLDYVDSNGARVIGLDFSAGAAAVANGLQNALGAGFTVSNPAGDTLRILDDGALGTTDIVSLETRTTVTGLQTGQLGLALFVDRNDADYTGSFAGAGQKLGFAGRIQVNSAVVNDNKLLVQFAAGGSLGDSGRVDQLLDSLDTMRFAGGLGTTGTSASFRLAGTVSDFISQTINYQGNAAAAALSDRETQELTVDALAQRLDTEYGVDVDEEMARLMELQNAFAANARVMSVAQELIQSLFEI